MTMSVNLACYVLLSRATIWLNWDSWIKSNWRRMVRKNGHRGSTQEKGNIELLS